MKPQTPRISNLDYLRKALRGTLAPTDESPFNFPFPIMQTLGFRLVEVSEASACVEMEAKTELHANPMGTLHGGVLCDIADAAIGTAHLTTIAEGESFTSIDLQINFFRPVWNERLTAVARAVHRARTVSRYVCDITRPDDKLIPQVMTTVMTLRGESAQGEMRVESSGGRDGREHFAVLWAQHRRAGFMSELIA
ncbi:MAG TPA: PaaI family thioesterase [Candidatus Udaeobacter sp.]|nr:PaaI family thioesterase [Candidatus Udaeobacter sp.]